MLLLLQSAMSLELVKFKASYTEQVVGALTACSFTSRSFFSWTRETCFVFSSSLWDSKFSKAFCSCANSSFSPALSSPPPTDLARGLILKKSLIQGQFFTAIKALMFSWIKTRASLKYEWKRRKTLRHTIKNVKKNGNTIINKTIAKDSKES